MVQCVSKTAAIDGVTSCYKDGHCLWSILYGIHCWMQHLLRCKGFLFKLQLNQVTNIITHSLLWFFSTLRLCQNWFQVHWGLRLLICSWWLTYLIISKLWCKSHKVLLFAISYTFDILFYCQDASAIHNVVQGVFLCINSYFVVLQQMDVQLMKMVKGFWHHIIT
jgi:hypothetical protein